METFISVNLNKSMIRFKLDYGYGDENTNFLKPLNSVHNASIKNISCC